MTKLKTLKDLQKHEIEIEKDHIDGFYIREDKLRKEAIKWVKDMVAGVKRDWVIHFFNITEEDLK